MRLLPIAAAGLLLLPSAGCKKAGPPAAFKPRKAGQFCAMTGKDHDIAKAKGKRQKAKTWNRRGFVIASISRRVVSELLPFAFCLLPFDFLTVSQTCSPDSPAR